MLPVLRATDDRGQIHVARTIVQVDDPAAATARFQSLWASFTTRLQAGDQAGALAQPTPGLRSQFASLFQRLEADLPAIAAGFPSIDLIDQSVIPPKRHDPGRGGVCILYFIYFRRDNQGRWLIQEMSAHEDRACPV